MGVAHIILLDARELPASRDEEHLVQGVGVRVEG
jgi:hypothetical protein